MDNNLIPVSPITEKTVSEIILLAKSSGQYDQHKKQKFGKIE